MSLAADTVENDAGNSHRRIVRGKTPQHGRGRLGLSGDIEHQHHRQSKARRQIGGGAAAPGRPGHAVEQAHHAFDNENFGVAGGFRHYGVEQRRRHGPAVQIATGGTARGSMKTRIDIIRSGLGGLDRNSPPPQRRQQRESDHGLAGTRTRGRHDEPTPDHWIPRS